MPRCPIHPSIPPVSSSKRPGDGFYAYVNDTWIRTHKIKPWQSEINISDEIQNITDKELEKLIAADTTLPRSLTPTKPYDHIRLFANIWKDTNPEREEAYLQVCLRELMEAREASSITQYFGWLCRSGINTILGIVTQQEIEKPYLLRISLTPGNLTLPIQYYTDTTLKSSDTWKAYEDFITTCSIELGLPFLHRALEAEIHIAKILNEPFKILVKTKKGRSLESWIPEFNWEGFMNGLHIDSKWRNRIWLLDAPERLEKILKWICKADKELVIAIFALHLIKFSSSYLRKPIQNSANHLFQKTLRGVTRTPPKDQLLLEDIKTFLPDALCIVYSQEQDKPDVIANISNLIKKLQESAIECISQTEVFSHKTRSRIKEKIHRMDFEIGKDTPAPLPNVTYTMDSLLHTIFNIQEGRMHLLPSIAGKSFDKETSSYPCYIVNASYFSEMNRIVMPWGILQWPFFCIDAPLGWNYGGIGATISHEMTHAFDMEGSMFNPRAIYKEWWTRKNRNTFKKETRKVARFYKKFTHYGLHIDGNNTLSENWADFGGLTIALHALKKELAEKNVDEKERKDAYKMFFISYACSWRTLVRKKKLLYSMRTSVHAPSEDRVDRIVVQFREWVEAFDIKESDPLYIPISQRLKFF